MILYVDMDDTLNDMSEHFFSYAKEFGIAAADSYIPASTYDMREYLYCEDALRWVDKIFRLEQFWYTIPIKPHAADAIEELNTVFELYIVTTPWLDHDACVTEKRAWIRKHLPFISISHQVIFARHKHLLRGDNAIIVEDAPHNIKKWEAWQTIIFDHLYNRRSWPPNDHVRLDNWYDIEEFLLRGMRKNEWRTTA